MSQIARSLINASEDALDTLVNRIQEDSARARVRTAQKRASRTDAHRNPLPKRPILLTSVAAPGVPLGDTMRKTWFRDMQYVILSGE